MPSPAPISTHLDLYRYWNFKRGNRRAPTRRDIEPTEIPRLLPNIALIDMVHDVYRWRLIGTRIVDDIGFDLTGRAFGCKAASLFVTAATGAFGRVLMAGKPVFEESVYQAVCGTDYSVSRLILPLSQNADCPPMLLVSRITRTIPARPQQIIRDRALGKVMSSIVVSSLPQLEQLAAGWDGASRLPQPIRVAPTPVLRVSGIWSNELPQVVHCGTGKLSLVTPASRR